MNYRGNARRWGCLRYNKASDTPRNVKPRVVGRRVTSYEPQLLSDPVGERRVDQLSDAAGVTGASPGNTTATPISPNFRNLWILLIRDVSPPSLTPAAPTTDSGEQTENDRDQYVER
jgi:hypothetical protein